MADRFHEDDVETHVPEKPLRFITLTAELDDGDLPGTGDPPIRFQAGCRLLNGKLVARDRPSERARDPVQKNSFKYNEAKYTKCKIQGQKAGDGTSGIDWNPLTLSTCGNLYKWLRLGFKERTTTLSRFKPGEAPGCTMDSTPLLASLLWRAIAAYSTRRKKMVPQMPSPGEVASGGSRSVPLFSVWVSRASTPCLVCKV